MNQYNYGDGANISMLQVPDTVEDPMGMLSGTISHPNLVSLYTTADTFPVLLDEAVDA